MNRKLRIALALPLLASALVVSGTPAGAQTGSVLIYGPALYGENIEGIVNELTLAADAGYEVTVANAETWAGMSATEFDDFDAVVLPDPNCTEDPSPLATAEENRATWSAAVLGNVVIAGTDPVYHVNTDDPAASTLISNAIDFAASGSGTGLYASLSCYYHDATTGTGVTVLDEFGEFTVTGDDAQNVTILEPGHAIMTGLSDSDLSDWTNSVHEAFDGFPSTFQAIAKENGLDLPYILASPGVPGAPTGVSALPGNGQAVVTWNAPESDGGSSIDQYGAKCTATGNPDDTHTATTDGATTATNVMGLTNEVEYGCKVRAHNAAGFGDFSDEALVTPSSATGAAVIDGAAGGSLSTSDGSTSSTVMLPPNPAGPEQVIVTVVQSGGGGSFNSVLSFGTCADAICVDVTADPPDAYPATNPILVVLQVPAVGDVTARQVFKETDAGSTLIANCIHPRQYVADPDPCVRKRKILGKGNNKFHQFHILASSADPRYRT